MKSLTNSHIYQLLLKMDVKFSKDFSYLIDKVFHIEEKLNELDERTASYPKLYDNVDKLMGEIIENRQERTFINKRLSALEKA